MMNIVFWTLVLKHEMRFDFGPYHTRLNICIKKADKRPILVSANQG
jgi:hypothetical protein